MTDHYRGIPGARYVSVDAESGELVKLIANEDGVITAETDAERRVADVWRLSRTKLPKLETKEVERLRTKEADR